MLLLTVSFINLSFAQTENSAKPEQIYAEIAVDVSPEFPGGWDEMSVIIYQKITNQKALRNSDKKIVAIFVVEKDGSLSNIEILNTTDKKLSQEIIAILSDAPKWTPASKNGELVRVIIVRPIPFN